MKNKVFKTVADARIGFRRADLLLKRPTSWWGRTICVAGISEYSHAAMLAIRNDCGWAVLDVMEKRGGSSRPLDKIVREQPGVWDHYRVATERFPEFDREAAETRMWKFDDCEYGWWELRKASLIYLPGIRLLQKVDKLCVDNGATDKTPPFCSMAYAIACDDGGGVDPVKNLRHSMTTPGHLAQSLLFEYHCTLVTGEWLEAKRKAA